MTECQRITGALADEIMAGRLACDQTATRIVLRIGSVTLFEQPPRPSTRASCRPPGKSPWRWTR